MSDNETILREGGVLHIVYLEDAVKWGVSDTFPLSGKDSYLTWLNRYRSLEGLSQGDIETWRKVYAQEGNRHAQFAKLVLAHIASATEDAVSRQPTIRKLEADRRANPASIIARAYVLGLPEAKPPVSRSNMSVVPPLSE